MKKRQTYQKLFFKEYNIAQVYLKDHLVEVFCKEFISINISDLKTFIKELKHDLPKTSHLVFINHIQPTTIFEIPAREFYLKTLTKNFKQAEAVVTENISQQFILETMLDRHPCEIPVNIFTDRLNAIKWAKRIIKE